MPSDQTPSAAQFRRVMGLFATGVCVVSTDPAAGETTAGAAPSRQPAGAQISAMTVNSFVSVSLEPMLICWNLQNSASQFALYAHAPRFAISILAEHQDALAQRYAARGDSMLRAEDFTRSAHGLPVIRDAIGHIECRHHASHPAGDHTMILGEVTAIGAIEQAASPPAPLGFFNGKFCSIGS